MVPKFIHNTKCDCDRFIYVNNHLKCHFCEQSLGYCYCLIKCCIYNVCPNCKLNCNKCDVKICENCSFECDICDKLRCYDCIRFCETCYKSYCEECICVCENCKGFTCTAYDARSTNCIQKCIDCKKKFCHYCSTCNICKKCGIIRKAYNETNTIMKLENLCCTIIRKYDIDKLSLPNYLKSKLKNQNIFIYEWTQFEYKNKKIMYMD